MSTELHEVDYRTLSLNPMTMFGEEWAALTAGNAERGYNSMCIAWGHLGAIWEDKLSDDRKRRNVRLPTAIVYVRPQRYTKEFMDREEYFTISFLGENNRKPVAYLGAHSGRDEDKIANAGVTPVFVDEYETCYLAEARLVFVCRKLYAEELTDAGFVDRQIIEGNYPERDLHTQYIGEIVRVLARDE